MTLSASRARYLSAIAAVLPSLAVAAACKESSAPTVTVTEGGTATSTASPSASAFPSASASPSASAIPAPSAATSTPPVPVGVGPGEPQFHMPSCPSGKFCVAEPAKLDPKKAAAAPYAKCAVTTAHPEDIAHDGGGRFRSISFSPENTAAERVKTPSSCCYSWVIPCPGGRVFRDATGTPSVARTIARDDWSAALGSVATAQLSPAERASLAEHWTREAAFEHASIASFAQLTLDLLAVGAPPDLLASAQHAALDEIEHARIAFALAAAYGAAPVGPAALVASPCARVRTLAEIVRTTFTDACVGESVASASLAEDARQAVDPVLRDLLGRMAEDEERHAELAWRIVAWALGSGDPSVLAALTEAQAEVLDELVTLTHGGAASSHHELRATVLREVVLPCSVELSRRTQGSVAA